MHDHNALVQYMQMAVSSAYGYVIGLPALGTSRPAPVLGMNLVTSHGAPPRSRDGAPHHGMPVNLYHFTRRVCCAEAAPSIWRSCALNACIVWHDLMLDGLRKS